MKHAFFWFTALVLAALVAAVAWKVREDAAAPPPAGAWGGAMPVSVSEVRARRFAEIVEALGTARAAESVTLTSQATDVISAVRFDSGDIVKAGETIAELADAEEAAALNEARAALAEARRGLDRFQDLNDRGVAPQARIDELRSAFDQAQARVRAVEARLSDRIIRAPFDGVLGLRNVSAGFLVRPGDVVATLDDVSTIKVDFTAPEIFISALKPGEVIDVRSDAYPDRTFEGRITMVDSRVDPITRTVIVRAEVDNPERALLPGMLMLVEVERDVRERVAAPELAVVREGPSAYVYVVAEAEKGLIVERRPVITGVRREGFIEIVEGLKPGERVVDAGVHRVRPGAPVTISDGAAAPGPSGPRPEDKGAAAGARGPAKQAG